jgi:hypothetical protein
VPGLTGRLAALFEASRFTATVAQEVKLRAAHFGPADNLDFFHSRAFEQEGPLNANAVTGDTADGEVGLVTPTPQTDHDTLEDLNTLPVAFDNAHMDFDGIARGQIRMAPVGRLLDKGID